MIVLDADVLIGALDGSDAHHDAARTLISAARHGGTEIAASAVTLTEVLVAQADDPTLLRKARSAIRLLGVEIHTPNEATGVEAARLRRRHPISVPDAYCLAAARQTGAAVASFDAKVRRAARSESIQLAATPSS